jgi:hypothetical protein
MLGRCEASSPGCTDADGDGYGTGADCTCSGIDCDDDDPDVGDRARATCELSTGSHGGCVASVRQCTAGIWGECASVPGETLAGGEACNGEDDDCDGAVDEDLGVFSCGLGVCRRTVKACSAARVGICRPGQPGAAVDSCNGEDDDCDGSLDEDCTTCIRVAPGGDDVTGAASGGSTPFASVQVAIDFAATHPNGPQRVCVAAGAECGASATFLGPAASDLVMRNGVSVVGQFESTTFTRCANSVTTLAPQTPLGIVFPAAVTNATLLDGFSITRIAASTTAGVTVAGAAGAQLSNLDIRDAPISTTTYGVNVIDGGHATIARSRIHGGIGSQTAVGVRASNARVALTDNCSSFETASGRCSSGCFIQGRRDVTFGASFAVVLDRASGSRVERSALCAHGQAGDVDDGEPPATVAALWLTGNAADVLVRGNSLTASNRWEDSPVYGVFAKDCDGASPWLVDNHRINASSDRGQSRVEGVHAEGDCHPVIDTNREISATMNPRDTVQEAVAVACLESGGNASRCVISGNRDLQTAGEIIDLTNPLRSLGVQCLGSCAKIVRNTIVARKGQQGGRYGGRGTGILLESSGAFVDRNAVGVGCVSQGIGIRAVDSWSRIQNNVLSGITGCTQDLFSHGNGAALLVDASGVNEIDVHSNHLSAATLAFTCSSPGTPGIALEGSTTLPSGAFRNNKIWPGCTPRATVEERSTNADPRWFQNNFVAVANTGSPALYLNEGSAVLTSATAINSLAGAAANTGFNADLPYVDQGTTVGVPLWDYFGNPRDDGLPDIGAYEQ